MRTWLGAKGFFGIEPLVAWSVEKSVRIHCIVEQYGQRKCQGDGPPPDAQKTGMIVVLGIHQNWKYRNSETLESASMPKVVTIPMPRAQAKDGRQARREVIPEKPRISVFSSDG